MCMLEYLLFEKMHVEKFVFWKIVCWNIKNVEPKHVQIFWMFNWSMLKYVHAHLVYVEKSACLTFL